MRFFFYGSLLDPAIRRAVMGRGAARRPIAPAALEGWRRRRWRHAIYPVLLRQPGAIVQGALIEGVDAEAASRLAAFEGPAYKVARVPVRITGGGVVDAYVFLPSRRHASPAPWDLAVWSRGSQRRALRLAHAQMARDGRMAMRELLTGWRRRVRESGSGRRHTVE